MAKSQILFGRNVLAEALRAKIEIKEIFVENEPSFEFARTLVATSRKNIPIRKGLPKIVKDQSHQGIAFESEHSFYWESLPENLSSIPFILLLNHLEDVQNLGAIARTAAAFGVGLIVHEERRSVHLNPAAVKASAGYAFRIGFYQVSNLSYFIKNLRKENFLVMGLENSSESQNLYETQINFPLAVVMGSEGEGLSRTVREGCDSLLKIPVKADVESLNVSQATAIALSYFYSNGSR